MPLELMLMAAELISKLVKIAAEFELTLYMIVDISADCV